MGIFSFLTGPNIQSISTKELDSLIGKVNLIDVRQPYEYKSRSIKGAKNIPLGEITSSDNILDKSKTYYIICQSGMRSMRASKTLAKKGYNVINVVGGMSAYRGNKVK